MLKSLVHVELDKLIENVKSFSEQGEVANYIPALKQKNKSDLAISIYTKEGILSGGDIEENFTIQSISKLITLAVALEELGFMKVFDKVGMEPTEDSFNSISNLEKHKKPINPMVNAGAITVTSMITGKDINEKMDKILYVIRKMTNNPEITFNKTVAESEYNHAFLNRSLCFLLKEYQIIQEDIEKLLELYTMQCSIEMSSTDLARMAMVLANKGRDPENGQVIISEEITRIVNTIMLICGMYNATGDIALNVGFPTKSGVSGTLLGVIPGRMGIGIYGPSLNEQGNSIAGTRLMELLSKQYDLYVL